MVAFDGFELDVSAYELRHRGQPVAMEPQVFEVLAHLIAHRDRVVTKEELLDEIWGSRFVSESALTSRIKTARRAVGDDGRNQRVIRTVHGRGYRFVADVEERSSVDDTEAESPHRPAPSAPATGALPAERTPLVGRSDELQAVGEALEQGRLTTLLAIGGSGKTRLAVAAARGFADRFTDGVWFVDLVPVQDGPGIELAVADAAQLAVGDADAPDGQLGSLIDGRDALFVIDNAEHLAADVAVVLDRLLETTTGPRFLVTSRVPLGLPDERRIAVGMLPTDGDDGGPAVEMLVAAAGRLGADTGDDPALLARICQHLDGLPLAIELAAAQLRHLGPAALAERLDRRFEVLAERSRPGRERHASLVDVLDDTVSALDVDEHDLLVRMTAFPSRFTLDDLAGVAGDREGGPIEAALGQLLDHSLVVRDGGAQPRYRLLETVKLFVRQRTAPEQVDAVDGRHAEWCLAEVGDDPRRYLYDFDLADWYSAHFDDLRSATRHLGRIDRPEDAARLTAASGLTVHSDSGARAAEVLGRVRDQLSTVADDRLVAQLHLTAVLCGMATRAPEVIASHGELAQVAAERDGDPFLTSAAAVLASWSVVFRDPDGAVALTARAGRIAEAAEDQAGRDFADGYRAFHLAVLRRYDEAEALARAVVDRASAAQRGGYPTHVAATAVLSVAFLADPAEMLEWIETGRGTPDVRYPMWSNDLLDATIHAANGRREATSAIVGGIEARLRQAGQDPYPDLLLPAAALAHQRGDTERAARWLRRVRDADRPTQSFQATVVYRRLREAVGEPTAPLDEASLADVGASALAWLAQTS